MEKTNLNLVDFENNILEISLSHLVALVGTVSRSDVGEHKYCYTGCLIELKGKWYILTVGHAIEDYLKAIKNGFKVESCGLFDGFHSCKKDKTESAIDGYYIEKNILSYKNEVASDGISDGGLSGLDYAILDLPEWFERQVRGNNKNAFRVNHLDGLDTVLGGNFYVTGVPEEMIEKDLSGNSSVRLDLEVGCMPLVRIKNSSQYAVELFCATITDKGHLDSIVGFSGGPIMLFIENKGKIHYRLLAIQNSWYKQAKIVFGTFVKEILNDLEKDKIITTPHF